MKVIAKMDDYGRFLVEVHRGELAKLCPVEADKIKVGDELKLGEGIRELDAVRYDLSNVKRISQGLREAADRLDRTSQIKLLDRPTKKKGS